jgi:protease PrsW
MSASPLVLILSIMAGVIPATIYALIIQRLDRYEKEPRLLLAVTFLWGAVPAILLAIVLEGILGAPLELLNSPGAEIVASGLIAPVVEEVTKGLAILGLYLVFRHEFDDLLDGIVYGALVGLGFGLTENVLYFARSHGDGGWTQWIVTVLVRSLVFGLVHSFYSGLVGAGFGQARVAKNSRARALWPLVGLSGAIVFHAIHNIVLSVSWSAPLAGLAVTAFSDWAGILLVLAMAGLSWRKEREWISHHLTEEIELGTLSQNEVNAFSAARPMATALWKIMTSGGVGQAVTLTRLYRRSVNLAFAKERASRESETVPDAELAALREAMQPLRAELGLPALPATACRRCGSVMALGQRYCTRCGQCAVRIPGR